MNPETNERDAELLSAYIDNELSAPERAELETRLVVDPVLQAELRDLRQTLALVRSLPVLPAPRNLTLRADAVADGSSAQPRMMQASNPRFWRYAPALAAALLVLAIGFVALLPQLVDFGNVNQGLSSQQVANAPTQSPQATQNRVAPTATMLASPIVAQPEAASADEAALQFTDQPQAAFSAPAEEPEAANRVPQATQPEVAIVQATATRADVVGGDAESAQDDIATFSPAAPITQAQESRAGAALPEPSALLGRAAAPSITGADVSLLLTRLLQAADARVLYGQGDAAVTLGDVLRLLVGLLAQAG